MNSNTISISPDVLSGTPVFKDTRVPIKNLFDYLETGKTVEEFLLGFPSVKKEQAVEVLEIAERFVESLNPNYEIAA
jgi:uncharacterized protein (DUF433 family)